MPRHSIPVVQQISAGCAELADAENSLWLATGAGDLVTLRLLDALLGLPEGDLSTLEPAVAEVAAAGGGGTAGGEAT